MKFDVFIAANLRKAVSACIKNSCQCFLRPITERHELTTNGVCARLRSLDALIDDQLIDL